MGSELYGAVLIFDKPFRRCFGSIAGFGPDVLKKVDANDEYGLER